MEELYITYEYIDNIDPANTANHIETYTDIVRKDHIEAFIKAGKKRSPNHFEIVKMIKYVGTERFLPMNLGSGFNISIRNRYFEKEKKELMENMYDYLKTDNGTEKEKNIIKTVLTKMNENNLPTHAQLALIDKLLG